MTANANGMLAAKIQRHEKKWVRMPPTLGPMMAAKPQTAPSKPSAEPRRSSGTLSAIAAVATGKIPPEPAAWTARAIRKIGNVGDTIARTLPAAKIATHNE